MNGSTHPLRPPLRHRVPPAARTVLCWTAVAVFPVVLFVAVVNGGNENTLYLWQLPISFRYVLPALAMALPAVVLRRAPLVTLALMLLASTALTVTVHSWESGYLSDVRYLQIAAIDVAVAYLAATRRRRVSVPVAVVALGAEIAVGFAGATRLDVNSRPEIPTLVMLIAWMVGNSVRARRRYGEALRAQAAAQAVTAERLRIARELHDMVAHSVSIIAIQAGMGSRMIESRPAEAGKALRAIEATSRDTLAGLRRLVVGLRQSSPDGPGAGSAPPAPAPGLADLDRLVATTAEAGVRIELRRTGRPRLLPGDIELAAYRVVQEAVTNVVRHAGTDACRVIIDHRDGELGIEVTDEGRGCVAPGTGYGLTGMRERVGLLHGRFDAGPRTGGGFRVAATLPLPELSGPTVAVPTADAAEPGTPTGTPPAAAATVPGSRPAGHGPGTAAEPAR
ncbi:sensor histidine kinase [Micromonospora sp. NPDC049559]|uniref:sensor histidine kinase n=1 Tax=Micromonospora sp. NPDC049559 TaxID=3155923 RepID=UPI00342E3D59